MAIAASYIPDPSQSDATASARAAALGIGIAPRQVPPRYANAVTQTPGIVAEYGNLVGFIHDDGTLTPSSVTTLLAPLNAQQAADQTAITNSQTIQQRLTTNLALLETFITNNPNGAVLSAAQTNVLARMLASTTRILLGLTSVVGGS